jgi:D-alanyl-D-alanine carboxypeptidase
MRTIRSFAAAAVLAALLAAGAATSAGKTYGANPADLAGKLDRLVRAYPGTIAGVEGDALVLKDGTRLPLSDGKSDKSFDELLDKPDIGDMFAFDYPAGAPAAAPAENFDPGRIRVEALFRALYGDCQKGTLAKQRQVKWVPKHRGGTVSFTTAQGADKALEAVSAELDRLPDSFAKYLVPPAGTYNCRVIANTDRMSMHAYAAAIDINTKQTTYWQWLKPGADGLYKWSNKIPPEIVAIFEKHGFIWGGRWYHFDTMHFEYRPELLRE